MCGFVGTTRHSLIKTMLMRQAHRGPDAQSYWADNTISLGHALLDISGARQVQPTTSAAGNIVVFNGEMYDSSIANDTKWLCEGLDKWGLEFLKMTDWHGVICWYKKAEGKLYLIRDHFGTKPLWWRFDGKDIDFATSLKSLLTKEVDETKLERFKKYGQLFFDESIYKNTYKVAAGEVLCFDTQTWRMKRTNLWDYFKIGSNKFNKEEFRQKLIESVLKVAKTKQKLGMFLSGGLDSTLVASILAKNNVPVEVWTCGYNLKQKGQYWMHEGFHNESEMAVRTCKELGIPIKRVILDRDERFYLGKFWISNTHYPWADHNRQAPRYKLAEAAAKSGCKVILTGDSGDELFTGYTHHDVRVNDKGNERFCQFNAKERAFPRNVFGSDWKNNSFFVDLLSTSEQNILATDQTIGMFGMESRIPLLTQHFAKYVISINGDTKFQQVDYCNFPTTKWLVREAFGDYLPNHVRYRLKKTGWSSPWDNNEDKSQKEWRESDIQMCRWLGL